MWPFGPVSTVPTDPAFPVAIESAEAVVPPGDEVVDELEELEVVVVVDAAVGDEEHAAAMIARPMIRPLRAKPRLCGMGSRWRASEATDLVTEVDVGLSMSISELG